MILGSQRPKLNKKGGNQGKASTNALPPDWRRMVVARWLMAGHKSVTSDVTDGSEQRVYNEPAPFKPEKVKRESRKNCSVFLSSANFL